MNKTIGIIIAAIIIIGGIYLLASRTPAPVNTNTSSSTSSADGRVVFSVTDAAADMSTISEINMKVNSVAVHNSTNGWVTVSTTPRTYSLLKLNAESKSELLADIKTKAGTYDQVRLGVDSISVMTKAGATREAKVPSGELKINTKVVVAENSTTSVNFDFLADKSLHMTGNGQYIFAPVVKTESKSDATVGVSTTNVVTVSGGHVDDENTVGMDIDGEVKLNFEINKSQKLNIGSDNMIKLEL